MLGLLNLENRKIKVTKEGSSKKKNLSKEEVLQLNDEDEVSVRWPIKICDKVYDYPAKVMPNMILKNTYFDLAGKWHSSRMVIRNTRFRSCCIAVETVRTGRGVFGKVASLEQSGEY